MSSLAASHFLVRNGLEPSSRSPAAIATASPCRPSCSARRRSASASSRFAATIPSSRPARGQGGSISIHGCSQPPAHARRGSASHGRADQWPGGVSCWRRRAARRPAGGLEAHRAAFENGRGAEFIQTQFCMDAGAVRRYARGCAIWRRAECHSHRVAPIPSARSARWMKEKLYGAMIPDGSSSGWSAPPTRRPRGRKSASSYCSSWSRFRCGGAHVMAPTFHSAIGPSIQDSGVAGRSARGRASAASASAAVAMPVGRGPNRHRSRFDS